MSNLLRNYIGIVFSLFLFAILLSFIIPITSLSEGMMGVHLERKAMRNDLLAQREIMFYSNKYLTGDDLMMAAEKYGRTLDIRVDLGTNRGNQVLTIDEWAVSSQNYNVSQLRKFLGSTALGEFHSTLLRDSSGTISGISFEYVGS